MTINQPTSNIPGLSEDSAGAVLTKAAAGATTGAANAVFADSDQLKQLLEVKYAGYYFPVVSFEESSSQDLAVHKYPNLDSARVELTGRNPSTYTCKAIFTNNIYPSDKESWKPGTLFPHVFELVLNALYDSTTYHVLQHPFLGFRNVVPVKWNYSFIGAGPRDGVYLDMIFIETIGEDNIQETISAPSNLSSMQGVSNALDTELSSPTIKAMNPPNLTLGQFFSKVNGFIRSAVSFPQQTIGALNAQVVQVNSSVQGAGSALATSPFQLYQSGEAIVNQNKGLVLHGPISNAYYYDKAVAAQVFNINQDALTNVYSTIGSLNSNASNTATQVIENAIAFTLAMITYYQSLQRVETANVVALLFQLLRLLQQNLVSLYNNNKSYRVNTFVVKVPSTLFSLSKILNNSIQQLLQLNSQLNKLYIIPDGTIIRYYQG